MHRQIGGLFALEYPAGIDAGLTRRGHNAASVAHQAAGRGELADSCGDRGHRVASCQRSQLVAAAVEECIDARSRARRPAVGPSVAKTVSKSRSVLAFRTWQTAARACGPLPASLSIGLGKSGIGRVDEQRNRSSPWGPASCSSASCFGPSSALNVVTPGDIAARSGKAGDKSEPRPGRRPMRNTIGNASRSPAFAASAACRAAKRSNQRHLSLHQIGRHRRQPIVLAERPAPFDGHVAAFNKAAPPRPFRKASTRCAVSSATWR